MKELKPHRNAMVQLLQDITTRGGTRFRKGVKMVLYGTEGGYFLCVKVRGKSHRLQLQKKRAYRDFVTIKAAPLNKRKTYEEIYDSGY